MKTIFKNFKKMVLENFLAFCAIVGGVLALAYIIYLGVYELPGSLGHVSHIKGAKL
jgi:hypothetical protein